MTLGYVVRCVPEVEAAVAVYEGAFGLARRSMHESVQYAGTKAGGPALAFAGEGMVSATCHAVRSNRPGEQPSGAEIAFVGEDGRLAVKTVLAAGAVGIVQPGEKPWGQSLASVRDLNGFVVEQCGARGT